MKFRTLPIFVFIAVANTSVPGGLLDARIDWGKVLLPELGRSSLAVVRLPQESDTALEITLRKKESMPQFKSLPTSKNQPDDKNTRPL
jgi:hypothetical protein